MPSEVVRSFYRAVAHRDPELISATIAEFFHENASILWPKSLPYGGRVVGARRIEKLFVGMASRPEPVGPENFEVVEVIHGGNHVVAEVKFDWRAPGIGGSVATRALELWAFESGRVSEIRAYYWDTAACRDHVMGNQSVSADA